LPPAPVVTTNTTSGTVGTAFSYTITATNGATSYTASPLPAGLTFNTATGVISGTPTAVGSTTTTITATNAGGTGSGTVTITINPAKPVVTTNTASGTTGVAFSYTITATNTPTSYAASPLPAGLTFNTATGVISGTPTAVGSTTTTITATNAGGTGTGTVTISITAALPPAPVVTTNTTSGTVGTAFSYTITATNTPTSYTATPLPAGLTFNTGTGVISGTPTAVGSTTTTITATNAGGTGTGIVTITINPAKPVVTTNTASGTTGVAFSYTITATNTATSYTATPLPAGLTFNTATGVISGTPTAVGSTTTTITATNAGGTGSGTVTITINPALMITSNGAVNGIIGTSFTYTITSNTVASYSSTALPPGLTLDHATGVISGTPTLLGVYPVTITATNANGSTNNALEITITNEPPVITSVNTQTVDAGEAFSYAITATNEPSGFTAKGLPAGIVFNSTTGEISGSTTITGVYTVTLGATNAAGTGTEILTLTIAGADTHFPPSMSPVLAPNPVRVDQLIQVSTPQWNVGQEVGIEVYNYLGVLAASENNIIVTTIELLEDKTDTPYSGPGIGINLPNLIAGDYILVLRSSDGRIVKKFRVQ